MSRRSNNNVVKVCWGVCAHFGGIAEDCDDNEDEDTWDFVLTQFGKHNRCKWANTASVARCFRSSIPRSGPPVPLVRVDMYVRNSGTRPAQANFKEHLTWGHCNYKNNRLKINYKTIIK